MKAVLNNVVLAEAETSDIVQVDGAWYFPPASLTEGVFVESPRGYTCSWKGDAQYYTLAAGDKTMVNGAWAYPNLPPRAVELIGTDVTGWVAFDPRVTMLDD